MAAPEEAPRRATGESHEDNCSVVARAIGEVGNVPPFRAAARDRSRNFAELGRAGRGRRGIMPGTTTSDSERLLELGEGACASCAGRTRTARIRPRALLGGQR